MNKNKGSRKEPVAQSRSRIQKRIIQLAQIIPAAAGYYTLNYTWGDRYPIVAWEVHDGHNNCHPVIPGPTDPEYHAIESPDGSIYDVVLDTCYRDKNDWKEARDNVVEEDPCYRPRPS